MRIKHTHLSFVLNKLSQRFVLTTITSLKPLLRFVNLRDELQVMQRRYMASFTTKTLHQSMMLRTH